MEKSYKYSLQLMYGNTIIYYSYDFYCLFNQMEMFNTCEDHSQIE